MQAWSPGLGRLSPPLKKGDLGGFEALEKSPLPPFIKGGEKYLFFPCQLNY
jgi:hypothetical protein